MSREREAARLESQREIFAEIAARAEGGDGRAEGAARGIVFSMDRALQLHALLESYRRLAEDPAPLAVLYRAGGEGHRRAYAEVRALHAGAEIEWLEERDFAGQTRGLLAETRAARVFFLVDDIVFIRPFALGGLARLPERYVPSLRLGRNCVRCYTKNRDMDAPPLAEGPEGLLQWRWAEGELDWGYPLSLDGHLLPTREVEILARRVPFRNPTTLERALQVALPIYGRRLGLCHGESRLVNLPLNKVQSENRNRHGEVSPEYLLERWRAGMRLDTEALAGAETRGPHDELEARFVPR